MKRWTSTADHRRGSLRLARQLGVQPRARHAPCDRGEGLPGQPRCAGEPDHRDQQGQGTAGLLEGGRVLLAAEPPRALPRHGEVGRARKVRRPTRGRRGGQGRRGPSCLARRASAWPARLASRLARPVPFDSCVLPSKFYHVLSRLTSVCPTSSRTLPRSGPLPLAGRRRR